MSGIELAHVALATVGTIVMVGLGFLYRPGLTTVLFSLAFITSMVSAYGQMAAAAAGSEPLRVISLGVGLGAPVLFWAGLRADRGAGAAVGWLAVVVGVGSATALVLTTGSDSFAWAFRISYAAAAVFAGLTVVELLRRPERAGGTSFPLAMFSVAFVGVAATSLASGVLAPSVDLGLLRDVNVIGLLVYIVCALITLLFIVRGGAITRSVGRGSASPGVFLQTATDRLDRAQSSGERSWAMLVIRLDDAADLRTAAGEAGFSALTARVAADVRETFPTEADIGALDASTFAVLLARPSSVIRENLRTLLRAIASPEQRNAVDVQCSVSIGWVGVAELGYDAETLLAAASEASATASADGGDRWERVGVPAA